MQATGKRYWRSLEELADSPRFQELMQREFPDEAADWANPITRRRFLTLLGASIALAGLAGCGSSHPPEEKILPYVRQPEGMVLGKPLFFATAMPLAGRAVGLLVESNEGRPTKIEGNPDHPASLGATDAFAQASVLTLYDPDRSQAVLYRGQPRPYTALVAQMREEFARRRQDKGAGLHILTEIISSPTLAARIQRLQNDFPKAKWHQYEPAAPDNALEGNRLAFGQPGDTLYHVDKADVILSLDADFLGCGPGHLPYVRAFAKRRRVGPGQPEMNRLYVVEPTPTPTGMKADLRLRLRASQIETFARLLASDLGLGAFASWEDLPVARDWVKMVGDDLRTHAGASIVLAGDGQPPAVHALAHAINQKLGNLGKTIVAIDPVDALPVNRLESLKDLVKDIDAGDVQTLLILGGNPVYNAPANLHFADKLQKVPLRVHLSLYNDETSFLCHWHVPEAHYLESWGDARAFDGTASIIQPLIAPLYGGKSALEALAAWTEPSQRSGYDLVREQWRGWWADHSDGGDFEHLWRKALHAGFIDKTAFTPKEVKLSPDWATRAGLQNDPQAELMEAQTLEVIFRPDPTIYDGRFANNGWLQELPKPVTKLTWDNAVLLSPATARDRGLGYAAPGGRGGEHGQAVTDLVEIHYRGEVLKAPILVVPGHADGSVTVHLGYGRTRAGRVGNNTGFNAYALRNSERPNFDTGLTLRKTGEQFTLACTQTHHPIGDQSGVAKERGIVHSGELSEYRKNPRSVLGEKHERFELPTLYQPEEFPYDGYKWGMVIDLGACVGCNACVVACQAENNIPIVGKTEVTHGREMHWLRIDRYYEGDADNPHAIFQPVPCMHCENAPCELVCPVEATTHSPDGLNEMTYNRCVGTRYCSNNCPYKVRRFNFLQYADYAKGSMNLLHNPDVTVRSRGVMEKCTYCVQRIREAEINAKNQNNRPIRDGEVFTACQAACPAEAIAFGDLNDKNSRVFKRRTEAEEAALHYGMLEELNTRPRTTYVAALRNT